MHDRHMWQTIGSNIESNHVRIQQEIAQKLEFPGRHPSREAVEGLHHLGVAGGASARAGDGLHRTVAVPASAGPAEVRRTLAQIVQAFFRGAGCLVGGPAR